MNMKTNKLDKPFTTYDEMIVKLREQNLSIPDDGRVKYLLTKLGYFDFISGYKNVFKDKDGNFKKYTQIDDIYALYCFDEELRALLLQYILKVEKHIKSLISYEFCSKYGNEQIGYLTHNNYDYTISNKEKVDILVEKLSNATQNNTSYIKHHKIKYNNIPLWVLIKSRTLGEISKMYSVLEIKMKRDISKNFGTTQYNELDRMLDFLSKIRNISAHNERLYNYKYQKRGILETEYHKKLNIEKKQNGNYIKGTKDLFAVVIILKCLLDKSDFEEFFFNLDIIITKTSAKSRFLPKSYLYKCMGFPENWKDIFDLL